MKDSVKKDSIVSQHSTIIISHCMLAETQRTSEQLRTCPELRDDDDAFKLKKYFYILNQWK